MHYTIKQASVEDTPILRKMLKQARLDISSVYWKNFLVAKDKTEIIGCIQLKQYPGVRELASMLVKKQHRGKGIGKVLVKHLLKDGIPPIFLICPQHRQSFYEQFGFYPIQKIQKLPFLLAARYAIGHFIAGRFYNIKIIAMRWDGPLSEPQS